MANELDLLTTYGEDALDNHFMISMGNFHEVGNLQNLVLRVLTCDLPAQAIPTYTINKRGKAFTRPAGGYEQGNDFTFSYRVDKYFDAYNSISRWMSWIKDPKTGAMASDSGPAGQGGPSLFRIPITVQAIDPNDVVLNKWEFLGCWPSNQDGISYTEDGGDPIVCSVTMQYTHIQYPN